MSSPEQVQKPASPSVFPVWSFTISWDPRSGFVNGRYLERAGEAGVQLLAGCRMLVALTGAAALELALPGMPLAGGAPLPLLASVTAVYALSSTYPRLIACAIMAGLLHGLHSPTLSFGVTALILLGCAVIAREFLERGGRRIAGHEYLVGGFVTLASMLAGHVALALSYPGGSAAFPFVLGRAFGSAFLAALIIVPVLRPVKIVVGRLVAWSGGMAMAFLCWFGSVLVRHLRTSGNEPGSMPGSPVPAQAGEGRAGEGGTDMTTASDQLGVPHGLAREPAEASRRNVRWLMIGFLGVLATMVLILVLYQLVGSREADSLYTHQTVRRANLPAERGALLSCEGEMLVWSRPVCRFVLDVRSLRHPRERLDLTVDRIQALLVRFSQRFESGPMSQPMDRAAIKERLLDRGPMEFLLNDKWDVSVEDEGRYARFRDEFPQISLEYRFRRECTITGPLVNSLGRVAWKGPKEDPAAPLWYRRDEMVGRSGMEAVLDTVVCGVGGTEQIIVDAFALHRVGTLERVEPIPGPPVRLTIQMPIQRLAEPCFLGTGQGSFIVMEVKSGKVRAMGSAPFAPYAYTAEEMKAFTDAPLMDRTRDSIPPPGSVFKPVTIAAGLMTGAVTPEFTAFCNGRASTGQGCEGHHGDTDVVHCLAYSCNVCAYEVGKRAGYKDVTAWANRFGIGNDPPRHTYGLPVAPSQVMTSKDGWPPGEIFSLAIGKGSTGVSLTSLAVYCCALFTDKVGAPIYVEEDSLPKEVRDRLPPREVRTVGLRDDVRKVILDGMLGCVEWARGTGRSARIQGLPVYAKTGTAQFSDGRKNATMMALVPAGDPKYCIVCTIENSALHGGSEVGPRLRKFLEGMLAQGYLSSNVAAGGE